MNRFLIAAGVGSGVGICYAVLNSSNPKSENESIKKESFPTWKSPSDLGLGPLRKLVDFGYIDKSGNLYSRDQTFMLKNCIDVTKSNGVIYALSSNQVISCDTQKNVFKGTKWFEKPIQISSTEDELLILSNYSKVYSLKEGKIQHLMDNVAEVASGSHHTLLRCHDGRVFGKGLNDKGQLGFKPCDDTELVEIDSIWSNSRSAKPLDAKCTSIAASNDTSYFVVETPNETRLSSCGSGLYGELGDGSFKQSTSYPCHLHSVNLIEYDEIQKKVSPVKLKVIAGPNVCAAITQYKDSPRDILVWGNVKGLGKVPTPIWFNTSPMSRLQLSSDQTICFVDSETFII